MKLGKCLGVSKMDNKELIKRLVEASREMMLEKYYGRHDKASKFNDVEEQMLKHYKDNNGAKERLSDDDKYWLVDTLGYLIDGINGTRYVRTTNPNYHNELNLQVIPGTLEIITEKLNWDGEYVDEYETTEQYAHKVQGRK